MPDRRPRPVHPHGSAAGLIVNEVVTNSLKYAFGAEAGEASVRVALQPQGAMLVLEVADNGRGVDAAARVDSGIGGRLTAAFAVQLGGRVERVSGSAGTAVTVRFPLPAG